MTTTKIFAILGASAVAAFGQSVAVTVAATSPTQAVLTYTAPGNSACTVEVSESNTYAPLVHDADPSLFAGANLDSRASAINSAGNLRIFVAGTRAIQTGSDSKNYSRALQQGTQHYFRVTCGSAVGTGTFTTKVLPMGTTYSDLIPLDANGNYLFPSVTQTRNAKLIDPQTGVLMTLVNVPSDNTTNSAPWPSAGGFGRYANDLVDAQGNYHVLFNDSPGGIFPSLYSINPTTGAANYLGSAYFYNETIAPDATGGITGVAGGTDTVMFDATDPNTIYVGVSVNTTRARSTIAKWTYTGNDTPLPGFAPAPATVVDLLGGQDLNTLAHNFNPALNTSEWGCGVVELQSHYFLLRCTGIGGVVQNVYAWEGAYDMGNGLPLGSGGNGHIVAMVPAWTLPGSRWCGDHTSEYLGNVPVMSFSVHSLTGITNPPYNHGGPYTSTLVGNIGSGDRTITITSTYPSGVGGPPAGYATGEPVSPNPDYFLMAAAVGDTFFIDSETFQITAKNSPTSWTVARGVGTTPVTSHSNGATVLMACQNALTLENSTGGYVWWDFVNNPTGTNPSQWVMNFGDHVVSRGNYRVDSGYSYRPGAVTNESTWGVNPAFYVTAHPIFSNSSAPADGNSYQKHPAMASGAATTFFDQTYFVGTTLFSAANSTATTRITGALYQYHYETSVSYQNGTLLTPKYFPTLTKTAGHAFVDVSGPGSVLTGNPVDNYKYCIANAVNECVAGSAIGNVYFNHPSLSPTTPWCTGGENGTGETDICIGNFAPNGLASIQFGIGNDHIGNLTYRPLTRLFETYEGMVTAPLKLTYGGEFAFMFQGTNTNPPAYTDNVWAIHVPPVPASDGIDRGTFVPAGLTLTAPTGMGVATARVKFWYAEQGGTLSSPYCTSRREACVTTASTINQANPFSYAATESYVPAPCAVSCTITIPVYPLHTAYYSAEFLNSLGNVVSTTQGIAMENVVVGGPNAAAPPAALSLSTVACNLASLGQSAAGTCTVTLSQAAPAGGSSVTLASNNALLTVPASVTVAAGATSATFNATAAASITGNQSAIVTATLGTSSTTATVNLLAPGLISTLVCNPASLGQSAAGTCTVTLTGAAPTGGSSVTLASNSALLTVPASVTVAAGATTATFSTTAAASITSNQSATVTATLGNSSKTATVSLSAQMAISTLTCNPASLAPRAAGTCTVTLTQAASTGGLSATLASNNTLLTVPSSVTVAAGATTATFSTTAAASIASNQSATVTATLGNSSKTATVSLSAPGPISSLACSPSSLEQSAVGACTVTLTQAAPTGGSAVRLASSSTSLTVPSSVTVAAGATTATFSARAATLIASNQSVTLTATLGGASTTTTLSLSAPVLIFTLTCSPASLGQSAAGTCTVTLTATAPTNGSSVTLATNNALLTVPASVTVAPGVTTATFSATAAASIASNQSATVTATLGSSSTTATVGLLAPGLMSTLACSPASLGPGAAGTCTVTLTQTAPIGGSAITLASNNTSLTVPASVTVVAGATKATFTATAAASLAVNQSATVTATFGGSSRISSISLVAASGAVGTLKASPASVALNIPVTAPVTTTVTLTYTNTSQSAPGFQATAAAGGATPWLTVSPSSGPMTQASFDGTTYTYSATVSVTADPTRFSAGSTFSGTINYTAADGTASTLATTLATMNVVDPTKFSVVPQSLSFSSTQGTSSPPAAQSVAVFSNPSGEPVTAKAVLNNGESWLTVSGGTTPAAVTASVNPNLAPGTYSAAVAISSAANTVNVPVSYTVVNLPPQLSVSPLTASLNLTQGASPASGQVTVSNTGGGTLQFSAQATSNQGTWLRVAGSGSGSATPSTPASLSFTTDPTGLTPGLYTGQITVQDANSTAQAVIDVTMAVTQATQSITLSQSGLTFSAVAGGQPPPSQPFTISSQGTGSLSWTAQPQTISTAGAATPNWLNITPAAGSSIAGQAGSPVQVSVNPAGLPAGQYYGSVNIAAPNAVNNPQTVTVLLNVTPTGQTSADAGVSTGGLIFSGPSGSTTPEQQQVSLLNPTSATIHYSTTVFTSSGAGWLSASPASGSVPPGGNASVSIAADLSALPPGVQTGTLSIGFDNGAVGVIQVTVIATSGTSGSGTTSGSGVASSSVDTHALMTSSACSGGKPGYLVPIFRQPSSQSVLQVAVAQRVQLQILDDCGSPLAAPNGGGAQVSFDNQDAPINLTDVGGGIWEGTWTPVNAAQPATLQAVASEQTLGLSSIAAAIAVTVQPASANAAGQTFAVVNAASGAQATPQVVTPGGYIAIYGTSLASNEAPLATTIPLPGTLNGTQFFLGGKPLPLLYAGSGQVNALIPQNLNPNTSYQLVIQRGSTLSVPAFLTVAEYQPGIYTMDLSGSGQGIVEIAGTALLAAPTGNGSRPVQRGSEYLSIFATGLGPVIGSNGEAPPADGAAAPLTTIYQTTAAVTATIGGVDAPVLFSGLTPSLVGLYQVNVQVPATAPAGDAVPLVLTVTDPVTGQSVQSNTVTIAAQ